MTRKYTRFGEQPVAYECSKKKCKWQGLDNEKNKTERDDDGYSESVCPNCGNNEFYGLLTQPK